MIAAGQAPERSAAVERWAQVVIMLAIGEAAGAGSFRHVHDEAAAHGQAGWLAWADAVVLELMSVASVWSCGVGSVHTSRPGSRRW